MATTHTISRRKPATYGKASSKSLRHKFSSSAFDHSPPTVGVLAPQSGPALSNTKKIDGFLLSHDQGRLSHQAIPTLEPKKSQPDLDYPRSRTEPNSIARTVEGTSTWEVLSSDDGKTSAQSTSRSTMKRRKILSPHMGDVAQKKVSRSVRSTGNIGSFLPTMASNNHADPLDDLPLCSSSDQVLNDSIHVTSPGAPTAKGQRLDKPTPFRAGHVSAYTTRVPHGKATLDSSISKSLVSTTNATLPPSSEVSKEQFYSVKRKDGAVTPLRDPEQGKCSSSSTLLTSARFKGSPESTTPYQRELWDMLLPKSNQSPVPNPIKLNKPKLRNKFASDQIRSTSESTETFAKATQMGRRSSRRGRIIDRLQPSERKRQEFVNNSVGSEVFSDPGCEDSAISDMVASATSGNSPGSPKDKQSDIPPPHNAHSSTAVQHHLPPGRGLRITYSSQRSHLANECLDEIPSIDLLLPADGTLQADVSPRRRLRMRAPSVDTTTVEESQSKIDCSHNSSVRTIHELRESGENVRQLNDLESLFDDMDEPGPIATSLRRSKLFELVRKLQEPTFCRLLLDQGYDCRLLAMSTSMGGDAITDSLFAIAMLYLVASPFVVRATSQTNDSRRADLFAMLLTDDRDIRTIAQSRRSNMSKSSQFNLNECVHLILQSSIWRSGVPTVLSGRIIGLQGLDYLIQKSREAGSESQILPPAIIGRVIGVLPSGKEAASLPPSADHILGTHLAVSILESCTISGVEFDDDQWSVVTLGPILSILSWLSRRTSPLSEGMRRLILRLYLNLTNNNPQLCHEFAGLEVIESILHIVESHFHVLSDPGQRADSSAVLDTLILALGTLINLVEWSSAVRHTMTSNAETGECFLTVLVGLFIARRKSAAEVMYNP